MLPPLSDKLDSKRQLLVPVAIVPSLVSTRRNALLELEKVDAVQVRSAGVKDRFVVEVFADSSATAAASASEEPTKPDDARLRRPTTRITWTQIEFVYLRNQLQAAAADPRAHRARVGVGAAAGAAGAQDHRGHPPLKAALKTEKTLAEFGLLRGNIYDTAWSAHNDAHCQFCAEFVELYVLGSANPEALTLRLLGEERALRKLTKLLNDLLTLTVRNSSVDGRGVCSGQAHVPQLLYSFLFGRDPEETEAA
ncbi:hypothetical protein ON010_g6668 [Phytophthora cinnamomi]|nr:hypothetical protein ON010_g6668 [Phytophthora cinnamomi]